MAPQKWEQTLRRQIRDNHGNGWNVIAQSGKCKLTRRYEDGTKSAKVLAIEWKAASWFCTIARTQAAPHWSWERCW